MISETIRIECDDLLISITSSYRKEISKQKQLFKANMPHGEKLNAEVELGEVTEIVDQIYSLTLQGYGRDDKVEAININLNLEELRLLGSAISKILQLPHYGI